MIWCAVDAYFRLLPSPIFNTGLRSILNRQSGYLFYMHPWEIDPEQPRITGVLRLPVHVTVHLHGESGGFPK